jgi:RecJ-like exonuclease
MTVPTIRLSLRPLALACLVVALVAGGCKGTTPISELLDDPARYTDETVRVAGKVTSAIGVFGTGIYEIDDGTGKLPVVAREGGVPREGAEVAVEGRMRVGFTIGTQTLTVLLEERRSTQ